MRAIPIHADVCVQSSRADLDYVEKELVLCVEWVRLIQLGINFADYIDSRVFGDNCCVTV